MSWQIRLSKLVNLWRNGEASVDPFFLYDVKPPDELPWPESVPHSSILAEFYGLYGGGRFGMGVNIDPVGELPKCTNYWIEHLRDYDSRGDILLSERHLVFGHDDAGAPIIWDSLDDSVASFWFKGGDWELIATTAGGFLVWLFSPSDKDEDWTHALRLIDAVDT